MQKLHFLLKGTWAYSAPRLVADNELSSGQQVILRREPNNEYDPNAVSVYSGSHKIGHLPRNLAAYIAPYLDSGGKYSGLVTNVGRKTYEGSKYPTVSVDFFFHDLAALSGSDLLLQSAREYEGVRGVYLLLNNAENKGYVGSSADVGKRLKQHINQLINGQHENMKMSVAWRRYGPQAFQLKLIEAVEGSDLLHREAYHISRLGTHANGYNQTPDGLGRIPEPGRHFVDIVSSTNYESSSTKMPSPQVAQLLPKPPPYKLPPLPPLPLAPKYHTNKCEINCPYCNYRLLVDFVTVKTEVQCPTCIREFFIIP